MHALEQARAQQRACTPLQLGRVPRRVGAPPPTAERSEDAHEGACEGRWRLLRPGRRDGCQQPRVRIPQLERAPAHVRPQRAARDAEHLCVCSKVGRRSPPARHDALRSRAEHALPHVRHARVGRTRRLTVRQPRRKRTPRRPHVPEPHARVEDALPARARARGCGQRTPRATELVAPRAAPRLARRRAPGDHRAPRRPGEGDGGRGVDGEPAKGVGTARSGLRSSARAAGSLGCHGQPRLRAQYGGATRACACAWPEVHARSTAHFTDRWLTRPSATSRSCRLTAAS